jgi:hypothetical protein
MRRDFQRLRARHGATDVVHPTTAARCCCRRAAVLRDVCPHSRLKAGRLQTANQEPYLWHIMSGARTPNSNAAALRAVELTCHRLCEENKLLMDTIQVLEAELPNPMPDGLDRHVFPNLFSFMGCARIARAKNETVKASSQAHVTFDQGDWTPLPPSPHPIHELPGTQCHHHDHYSFWFKLF